MRRRAVLALPLAARAQAPASLPSIEIWYGTHQRIGHLGDAQDDVNILGRLHGPRLTGFQYRLNGGDPVGLETRPYRRLAAEGDFNADVPVRLLRSGENRVTFEVLSLDGPLVRNNVVIEKLAARRPLPVRIDWSTINHPQDAGQCVDGRWALTSGGLRTVETGYDRLFLIGERSWMDYEVTAAVTIHRVDRETSAVSGGNGLGLIARFAGHIVGGHRAFPIAQPKWGYQPFGAIGWLRWRRGHPDAPPQLQFYPGDHDGFRNHGEFAIQTGIQYSLKLTCETLPNAGTHAGATRYRFKIWGGALAEPDAWSWTQVQISRFARRTGGVALLAHHVDATFGPLTIRGLSSS